MRKGVVLLVSVALALLLASGVALAAFPGQNGKIAFVSERDGNAEIYAMSPDGSDQRRLTDDPAEDLQPAWSPDGRRIAFVSDRTGVYQVHVMRADGTGLRQVTKAAKPSFSPAWSRSGRRLVFERDVGGSRGYDLFVITANGSSGGRLTDAVGDEYDPDWSPNGKAIVFASASAKGNRLCTVTPRGTGRDCFAVSKREEWVRYAPDYSPDGSRVVFLVADNIFSDTHIYKVRVGGGRITTIDSGDGATFVDNPVFSPDGRKVAYDRDRYDGQYQVYSANPDGSGRRKLTTDIRGDNYDPDWQPLP